MGEYSFALGIVDFSVQFPGTNDIYVISPMYWVPNDTTNISSPGAMKSLSGFKSTLIEPLEYFDFIKHSRKKFSYATTVNDNMDYLKLIVIIPTKFLVSKTKIETGAHMHQLYKSLSNQTIM